MTTEEIARLLHATLHGDSTRDIRGVGSLESAGPDELTHPKLAFIRATEALRPAVRQATGIHPTAMIAPGAELAAGVSVGPYAVIERGATVGAGTRLGAGVYLGEGVVVGAECVFYARVTVYAQGRIGDRVV